MNIKTVDNRMVSKNLLFMGFYLFFMTISTLSYSAEVINEYSRIVNTSKAKHHKEDKSIMTFTLNLWAPDQVAPAEAKPVEIGDNYQYLYDPETQIVQQNKRNRKVEFKFHSDLGERYQFRWLTADNPQYVTLTKMKKHHMLVSLDDGELSEYTYFELWVYDTQTGDVFMCDPIIIARRTGH